jgi:hypothetical protein
MFDRGPFRPGVPRVWTPARMRRMRRAGPVTIARSERREAGIPPSSEQSPSGSARSAKSGEDMSTRYRCGACGNLTRFDVLASRRTRAFHHYSIGGELTVEEEDVLEDRIEQVTCRWCGASGDTIEKFPVDGEMEESA